MARRFDIYLKVKDAQKIPSGPAFNKLSSEWELSCSGKNVRNKEWLGGLEIIAYGGDAQSNKSPVIIDKFHKRNYVEVEWGLLREKYLQGIPKWDLVKQELLHPKGRKIDKISIAINGEQFPRDFFFDVTGFEPALLLVPFFSARHSLQWHPSPINKEHL